MITSIFRLKNQIMTYAWGSRTALAGFLGQTNPSGQPQAEMWMGAHPKASSLVNFQGQWQSLESLISQCPQEFLGPRVTDIFGARLPFLMKVLAAGQPLSIQAHPSKEQAAAGFARENAAGVSLSDDRRNYRDAEHKPECLCAMTPFTGVCGFRPLGDMLALLLRVWPADAVESLGILQAEAPGNGLNLFFRQLMTLDSRRREDLLAWVVSRSQALSGEHEAFEWVCRLHGRYPGDIGILMPILLNLVTLRPREALFLPAGQLHAYFSGLGIEVMANSDNVLRGGLTPKHVDVPELLEILDFEPRLPDRMEPVAINASEQRYPERTGEFAISIIETSKDLTFHSTIDEARTPEIVLCAQGEAWLKSCHSGETLVLHQGQSAFIPYAIGRYIIEGNALLYKSCVNI